MVVFVGFYDDGSVVEVAWQESALCMVLDGCPDECGGMDVEVSEDGCGEECGGGFSVCSGDGDVGVVVEEVAQELCASFYVEVEVSCFLEEGVVIG